MNGGLLLSTIPLTVFGARIAPAPGNDVAAQMNDLVLGADNGRHGDILLSDEPSIPDLDRELSIELEAATPDLLRTNRDRLKAAFMGAVTLVFDDRPTRLWRARASGFLPAYDGASHTATTCQVRVPLKVRPFSEKCTSAGVIDPTIIALPVGTRVALPMGTAPSDTVWSVNGGGVGITGFAIIVRDRAGNKVFEFPYPGGISDSERVVITTERSAVEKVNAAGVVSAAYSGWDRTVTAETNDFPVLRPQDADYARAEWATAELAAGSAGTPYGELRYVECDR